MTLFEIAGQRSTSQAYWVTLALISNIVNYLKYNYFLDCDGIDNVTLRLWKFSDFCSRHTVGVAGDDIMFHILVTYTFVWTEHYGIWCWSLLVLEWTLFSPLNPLYSLMGVGVTGPPLSTNWSGRVLQAISIVMFTDLKHTTISIMSQWNGCFVLKSQSRPDVYCLYICTKSNTVMFNMM